MFTNLEIFIEDIIKFEVYLLKSASQIISIMVLPSLIFIKICTFKINVKNLKLHMFSIKDFSIIFN